jgi:hypothetical protein
MPAKVFQPYQPLLLRILHGLIGGMGLAALVTAFWTYDTYDGRWGRLPLPKLEAIEGIHGTFGLWVLLIFPVFVVYAFRRGQHRLIQPDSLKKLGQVGQPIWWYTLHRATNTLTLVGLAFALFSGKMMDEKWLPRGELTHVWYYAHLLSWVVMVVCLALHVLMSAKVGGLPLLLSMIHYRFREKDSPVYWRQHIETWFHQHQLRNIVSWCHSSWFFGSLEGMFLLIVVLAWIFSALPK